MMTPMLFYKVQLEMILKAAPAKVILVIVEALEAPAV
jgi:hypothetical protein